MRLKTYKMAISILPKFLTLKWNISRTIWRIEVGNGSSFCIFHAFSYELNFFRPEVPFNSADVTLLVLHTLSLCTADVTLLLLHTLSPDTVHSLPILQVCPFWYLTPSPRRCDSLGTSYFLPSPSTPSLCTADVTL